MEIQTLRDGKGRQFCFPHEIRVGVCNFCRAVVPFDARQTQRHHINAVDYDDILKDTMKIVDDGKANRTANLRICLSFSIVST